MVLTVYFMFRPTVWRWCEDWAYGTLFACGHTRHGNESSRILTLQQWMLACTHKAPSHQSGPVSFFICNGQIQMCSTYLHTYIYVCMYVGSYHPSLSLALHAIPLNSTVNFHYQSEFNIPLYEGPKWGVADP